MGKGGVLRGAGGVIYAEQALLPLPLTLSARCLEPEGAQGASERALGARASRGGTRPLPAPPPPPRLGAPRGARASPRVREPSPARPHCGRAPVRLYRLQRASGGAPADRPAGGRAGSAGPRSPRDGLAAGGGSLLCSLLGPAARRRSPAAASRGGPGRRS